MAPRADARKPRSAPLQQARPASPPTKHHATCEGGHGPGDPNPSSGGGRVGGGASVFRGQGKALDGDDGSSGDAGQRKAEGSARGPLLPATCANQDSGQEP